MPPRKTTSTAQESGGIDRGTQSGDSGSRLANDPIPLAHSVTLRVLIVDDEASVRKVMAAVLAQHNITCETAASGEEALRVLETPRKNGGISSLQMPGM